MQRQPRGRAGEILPSALRIVVVGRICAAHSVIETL
jgi:hypothetical protein